MWFAFPKLGLLLKPRDSASRHHSAASLLGLSREMTPSTWLECGRAETISVARPSRYAPHPSSLLFCVSGRRFCGMKLVKVFYEHAQAGVRCGFCIPRRKLFFVMFQIEIEWIIWIHVDENQVRIVHDQFIEAKTIIFV